MGQHIITRATAISLFSHPNFKVSDPEGVLDDVSGQDLVRWTLDAAAAFISPPKVDGENQEFDCGDIAFALRNTLTDHLCQKVRDVCKDGGGGKTDSNSCTSVFPYSQPTIPGIGIPGEPAREPTDAEEVISSFLFGGFSPSQCAETYQVSESDVLQMIREALSRG